MRPSVLPKLIVEHNVYLMETRKEKDAAYSPNSAASGHSRDFSGVSDDDSPLTHTFSFQEQTRFSDSSSSLATIPSKFEQHLDSPRVSRNTLDDLVEVADERDDGFDLCDLALTSSLCQCKNTQSFPAQMQPLTLPGSSSSLCNRQCVSASALERPSLDYSLADGFNSDGEASLRLQKVRRRSGDSSIVSLASRIGSRLPSLSRKPREKAPLSTGNRLSVQSAPASHAPSRTSSFRLPSLKKSLIHQSDKQNAAVLTPPATPTSAPVEMVSDDLNELADVYVQTPILEDPIDRKALASTPLLPTALIEHRASESDAVQSPLQSPTVANSPAFSFAASPNLTPLIAPMPTPPLSSRPSIASFGANQCSQVLALSDASSSELSSAEAKWTARLGHANFTVHPAPYVPENCDSVACKRLVEDWEEARKQFISQAARTSEHYGPTSQVYKLTERKWAEIDARWRRNHTIAVEQAKKADVINEESIHEQKLPERAYQPLAEPEPLVKLPSLSDPDNTGKFPKLEEGDMVGPMVQYAQLTTQSSKRTAFLKFFKDLQFPGNTLGRAPPGFQP